jgi:cyclopropane-fatty-acyl-phospholipid synthase
MSEKIKRTVTKILGSADIKINGSRPWDIQVKNEDLYARVLSGGSLALGESYMDGWWDCKKLDQFFDKLLSAGLDYKVVNLWTLGAGYTKAKLINLQKGRRAFHIGKAHYDTGNKLFKNMLDKRLAYSCGYWKDAKTLDAAQEAKLDLICRKIGLKKGMTVLDIGCGWASFVKFAAEKYGAKVLGVTVSNEQAEYARKICKGLPVEIRLQDYRDINQKFDRIVSVGMIEHVGVKNYNTYFEVAKRCLKDDGLFLLHTIGSLKSTSTTDPWISKYIFPNSMLPSLKQLTKAVEKKFVIEDIHNFSAYYDKTLMAWYDNFTKNWDKIKSDYDDRFYRMWVYYLLACAGSFRARKNQLWQIVLSKEGIRHGYERLS